MDICVLNPFFYPYQGGTEKVLFEIYSRIARNNNVTVISAAPRDKNQNSTEEISGIKVIRLKTSYWDLPILPLPFLSFHGLNYAIVRENSEIYHLNNRYQYFYGTLSAIKRIDKKLAITIHNSLPMNIDPVIDNLGLFYDDIWGRRLIHNSDIITGVSKYAIDVTVPKTDIKRSSVIYNGVDYNKFEKIEKNDKRIVDIKRKLGFGGRTIITNGRLVKQKGQIYLIKAVAELINEGYKDLDLLIIGRGSLENYFYGVARSLGIEKNFRISYSIDESMLPYYYNLGDLFVLPSLYEPASLAVLEALSCELPSVVSDIGGLTEMSGAYGIRAKPKSVAEIKERIIYVLENENEARSMARKGRKLMLERHDWDKIAKKYERLFLDYARY